MKKISTNKAITIFTLVMLLPFTFLSISIFLFFTHQKENDFKQTMRRFTDNESYFAVEHPGEEMKLLLTSLSGSMKGNAIEKYISSEFIGLNLLIPSIVDSTLYFRSAAVSDTKDNYKIYPPLKIKDFKASNRPWYPHSSFKDEIVFSEPYNTTDSYGKKIISQSLI